MAATLTAKPRFTSKNGVQVGMFSCEKPIEGELWRFHAPVSVNLLERRAEVTRVAQATGCEIVAVHAHRFDVVEGPNKGYSMSAFKANLSQL